jgi:hypothetical protein
MGDPAVNPIVPDTVLTYNKLYIRPDIGSIFSSSHIC